jgi:hypothetical protein
LVAAFFDNEFIWKMTIFQQLQVPADTLPAPPREPNYTSKLYKALPLVLKLLVDGSNYQSWIVMVQQALESTLQHRVHLSTPNLVLSDTEDILLRTTLLATADDNIKIGVASAPTGLDGLKLVLDSYTQRSRTAHVAMMQEILETKFNLSEKSTDAYTLFRRIKNLFKNLYWPGFKLTEESFLGMLYHVLLPNLEGFPFVKVARQIDLRMSQGKLEIANTDLVLLVHNKLTLYQGRGQNPNKPGGNGAATSKPGNPNGATSARTTCTTPTIAASQTPTRPDPPLALMAITAVVSPTTKQLRHRLVATSRPILPRSNTTTTTRPYRTTRSSNPSPPCQLQTASRRRTSISSNNAAAVFLVLTRAHHTRSRMICLCSPNPKPSAIPFPIMLPPMALNLLLL